MRQLRANFAATFRDPIIAGERQSLLLGRLWIFTAIVELTVVVVIVILIVAIAATAAVTSLLFPLPLPTLLYLLGLLLP